MSPDFPRLSLHPLCKMFPEMDEESYQNLKEDIRKNGQRLSIMTHDGKIVDGRHRYRACKELGVLPHVREIPLKKDESLAEAIASLNLHRRDLTKSQKATVANELQKAILAEREEITKRLAKEARERKKQRKAHPPGEPPVPKPKPGKQKRASHLAAEMTGVSHGYVETAASLEKENPELYEQVRKGKLKLSEAKARHNAAVKEAELAKKAAEGAAAVAEAPKPFLLVHGDAADIMETMRTTKPEVRYDAVITDPPYNQGVDYGLGAEKDRASYGEYVDWLGKWMNAAYELLNDDGFMAVVVPKNYQPAAMLTLEELFGGAENVDFVTWYETFGVNRSNWFNSTSRFVCFGWKNVEERVFHKKLFARPSDRQAKYNDKRAAAGGKLWDDVWGIEPPIPRITGNSEERVPGFPNQIPLALARPLVLGLTNPGARILDPFCGSGTFCVPVIESGDRFYTGIDLSEKSLAVAEKRLTALYAPSNGKEKPGKKKKLANV